MLNTKLNTYFIDGFTSRIKPQSIAYLLRESAYTGLWTLKMKCTQYGICGQSNLQECKGNVSFEVGLDGQKISVGFRKKSRSFFRGMPGPYPSPPKSVGLQSYKAAMTRHVL